MIYMKMRVKSLFQVVGKIGTKTTTSSENNEVIREGRSRNKAELGDFPDGPVAKTLHSQCSGPRFDPWSGN